VDNQRTFMPICSLCWLYDVLLFFFKGNYNFFLDRDLAIKEFSKLDGMEYYFIPVLWGIVGFASLGIYLLN